MTIRLNNLPSCVLDISSPFGLRYHPIHKKDMPHNGVDLRPYKRGATDDRIVATMPGRVSRNAFDASAGNLIVLDHGSGITTHNFHLKDRSPLAVGTIVKPLQTIGVMGTTGSSTGVHLHFEIRRNNTPEDPFEALLRVKKFRWEDMKNMPIYDYMEQLTGDWKDAVEWAKEVKLINGVNEDRMGLRESEVKGIVFLYRNAQRTDTLAGVRKA